MYDDLLANMARYVTLTEAAERDLIDLVRELPLRRRQFVAQPGFVSDTRNYVHRGALRSYFIDEDGKEHTVQIAVEDWFISDFYSYISREPGKLFVEAMEDGLLYQLPYDRIEAACRRHHCLSEYFRRTTERAFAFSRKRVQANISMTAEERYLAYLARYPDIAQRVPQYVIASYLGMSPEFLSKIRSKLAQP